MNLNANPNFEEFRAMLADCDDQNYSHKFWVTREGDFRITRIPIGSNFDPHFDAKKDGAKFHLETFPYKGNYTGPEGANDEVWARRVFDALLKSWADGTQGYVEHF